MTGVEVFEEAIMDFGVDAALEYFATPEEFRHLWDEMKEKELKTRDPERLNKHQEADYDFLLSLKDKRKAYQ
jgi:hypothetical protein